MDVKESDGEVGRKKVRPAVQLYRPGMLKTGTDITANKSRIEHRNININNNSNLNDAAKRPPRAPLADNGYRQKRYEESACDETDSIRFSSHSNTRNRGRGRGGEHRRDGHFDDRSFECNSISSIDEVWSIAGDGTAPQKRTIRRKSSQDSSHSGTYKPVSASTASSGKSSLGSFHENSYEDVGPSRQYGHNSSRQFHGSSQSLFERPTAMHENFIAEDKEWRRNAKSRGGHSGKRYNNPEANNFQNLTTRLEQYKPRQESGVFRSTFIRNERYGSYREDRKSVGHSSRRQGGANGIPSDDVDIYGFRKLSNSDRERGTEKNMRQRGRWNRNDHTVLKGEQAGKEQPSTASSSENAEIVEGGTGSSRHSAQSGQHMSFQDLCASVDSLEMGSFDWSTEVEAEEQRKREREERVQKEEQEKMEAEKLAKEKEQQQVSIHPRQRLDFYNRNQSGNAVWGRLRKRIDSHTSYVSQGSSAAGSLEEVINEDIESGEKTPTYEDRSGRGLRSDINDALRRTFDGEKRRLSDNYRRSNRRGSEKSHKYSQQRRSFKRDNTDTNRQVDTFETPEAQFLSANAANAKYNVISKTQNSSSLPPGMIAVNVSIPSNLSVPSPRISRPLMSVALGSSLRTENLQAVKPLLHQDHAEVPEAHLGRKKVIARVSVTERKRSSNSHPTEWPIHKEISRKEGPQIQQLNDTMCILFERIADSADVAAGEQLLIASEALSQLYMSIMTREIDYTYAMNLEQHLWKQCFYKPIEALRTASNASGEVAIGFRKSLAILLQQGFSFYMKLLEQYETVFGFKYEDYIYWLTGLPIDDLTNCTFVGRGARVAPDRSIRLALMSLQRLTVSLGDLYRYNAMVTGLKDYSMARLWYQKSAQLGPGNGRPYNQLALLAVYASKWVDVIFYYVRALAARYPFETARQPLFTAFNDMRKKISEYEAELDERLGQHSSQQESELTREDRPYEIWITPDGNVSKRDYKAASEENDSLQVFASESRETLYRRTLAYILFTSGLLITKIGMERFDVISQRALMQLSALLSFEHSPLTALQLVQLVSVFLFAVHSLTPTNGDPETCTAQQQYAVQTVLSVLGVLLKPVEECLPELEGLLSGEISLKNKVRRVLPSIFVYCEWLSTPYINKIYNKMPSLEPLECENFTIKTWHMLANIANTIVATEGKLARNVSIGSDRTPSLAVLLPETVFLASFAEAFPATPKSLHLVNGIVQDDDNKSALLALHARLSSVLSLADFLDGSELHCFRYDEKNHCFSVTVSTASGSEHPSIENEATPSNCNVEIAVLESNCESVPEVEMSQEQIKYRKTKKENQLKQEILEKETAVDRRIVIEVKPVYVVLDTNCFIYHLESIKRIVDSRKFTVLVPTMVIAELEGLRRRPDSKGALGSGQLLDDEHNCWIQQRAGLACDYLQQAKHKEGSQISAISSKGNKFQLCFVAEQEEIRSEKTVNDDLILSTCVEFSKELSKDKNDKQDPLRLRRNVVLLTEDRTLIIKAVCANIPSRTIPSFMDWAALS